MILNCCKFKIETICYAQSFKSSQTLIKKEEQTSSPLEKCLKDGVVEKVIRINEITTILKPIEFAMMGLENYIVENYS